MNCGECGKPLDMSNVFLDSIHCEHCGLYNKMVGCSICGGSGVDTTVMGPCSGCYSMGWTAEQENLDAINRRDKR